MDKKNIIIIIGFILAVILTAVITTLIVKNVEKKENAKTNEVSKEESLDFNEDTNKQEESDKTSDTNQNTTVKDESVSNKEKKEEQKNTTSNNKTIKEEPVSASNHATKTETDVITYIEEVSEASTGEKLKKGFVTVVDFLFYDGEIYGKTFKELSNSAKIKVTSLALKIDSKIDEYFPDYKEKISSNTNKVYTSIKTKLVALYLDTTVKICNDNPTLCEDAKAGLKDLKTSFGITWDFIKDITGVGITKLKDWYEVWKEE